MMYAIAFLISFVVCFFINPTKKSAIYSIFVLSFTFQYSVAIASMMLTYDNLFIATSWEYRLHALLLVIFAFISANFVILILRPRLPSPKNLRLPFGQLNIIVAALSVLGIVLLIDSTDLLNYGSRLMSRAGRGYVFIFGFLAFAAALNFAQFGPRKRPKWSWIVLMAAIVFFMIAGYRSFVMLCILSLVLSFVGITAILGRLRFAFFAATLTVVAVPINFMTGAIRSLASGSRSELSYNSVVDLADNLAENQTVPMANTHLDILAFYLQGASFEDKMFGTASTIWPSITNFLPRSFFPDKSDTTGVIMAQQIFPEWFHYGEHTSSVTVGLIFEMIFNFGIPAGLLLFSAFIAAACLLFKILMRIPLYGAYFAPILAWCFFFNIFFDDLGGIVNKIVLIIIGLVGVAVVHQFRARGTSRQGIAMVDPVTKRNRG